MNKMTKDGEVAVLVSPDYGSGWSTWNNDKYPRTDMVFSPELVTAVLAGAKPEELVTLAKNLFPDAYTNGAGQLTVEWIPEGAEFIIDEHDGWEVVMLAGEVDWMIA